MPMLANSFSSFLPFLIPVVAIVMGCAIPILAIVVDYIKRRKIYEMHHRERMAAIDKGMEPPPLPPDLLDNGHGKHGRRPRYLLRGLVWLVIGLTLVIALFANEDLRTALWGLIPTGIGVAYLIYYSVEGKRLEEEARKLETTGAPRV